MVCTVFSVDKLPVVIFSNGVVRSVVKIGVVKKMDDVEVVGDISVVIVVVVVEAVPAFGCSALYQLYNLMQSSTVNL